METLKTERYISLDDAAEYLGIKPVTLRSWIRNPNNEIPAHKIGRFWKFKCSEIDEWVNSGKSAINS
ncbi:DNA binding domain-containing protein, excisionase family [Lachnospiraceae bacterium]|nr:DNA binding domain-containing protein, excisionase family [Lachnospiraceae bacterium]